MSVTIQPEIKVDRPQREANRQEGNWHQQSVEQTIDLLETDSEYGLDPEEANKRLGIYGPNALTHHETTNAFKLLLRQFTSSLILLLLFAGAVSGLLGDVKDMFVIWIIVLLNGLIAFHQEYRAEKGFESLRKLATPLTRVRRGGLWREVAACDLVPGDIVYLETGFVVPADGRVQTSENLRIEEAALTGESESVEKNSNAISQANVVIADRTNMAYMGTHVVYGRGTLIVTSTGNRTELGRISQFLKQLGKEITPLQRKMQQLGGQLVIAAILVIAIIFLAGILQGVQLRLMFFTAISLAVAAVPEGLPAVVTIALALGAQRMLKRNALIRKLPAVETLGVVTVICSDKTGTLTENQMQVAVIDVLTDRVELQHGKVAPDLIESKPSIALLLAGASLCNDAVIQFESENSSHMKRFGDPTEVACLLAGSNSGLDKTLLENEMPRVGEIPFTSARKRMTTLHKKHLNSLGIMDKLLSGSKTAISSNHVAFTKGAVDTLLEVSSQVWAEGSTQDLTDDLKKQVAERNDGLASQGMRVLGIAMKFLRAPEANATKIEKDLVFIGIIGMIDPPRKEAKQAVEFCKDAGIRPIMITGDHPLTAKYVANELSIPTEAILTGNHLSTLSPEDLEKSVKEVSVFARISPEDKLNIVNSLKNQGEVVAVTGDGVNDAPALKRADIGVAMGITGSDVAKEAADMVLTDDNFATLVSAVSEGRRIYENIRKFLRYILTTNSAELWVMVLSSLLGMPLALLPLQILWINLVTDGLPALALSFEPAERNVMKRHPYKVEESIFSRGLGWGIIWSGLLMGIVVTAAGYWLWCLNNPAWQTLIFTTLTISQMGSVLAIRSEKETLFRTGILSNKILLWAVVLTVMLQLAVTYLPVLQRTLETKPLTIFELAIAFVCSLVIFLALETEKWLRNRLHK